MVHPGDSNPRCVPAAARPARIRRPGVSRTQDILPEDSGGLWFQSSDSSYWLTQDMPKVRE